MVRTQDGRWHDVARGAGLVGADGVVRQTVFAEMSALAARTRAINLGQGFPDVDGPPAVARAAMAAIEAGHNQYPPGAGIPELRRAVVVHQERHYGMRLDPDSEVLVTTGATEGVAAAVLALAGPGDEVLTIEPFYDSYAAVIAMAGATHTTVGLKDRVALGASVLDPVALAAAFSDRTRIVLLNSPHNPTGAVLSPADLEAVAALATAHDAVVVTDEVYEHLTFDGAVHVPLATLPGMAERTLTVSSAGKTLSFTGWKIGWVTGPVELVEAVRTVKQYLTFVSGAPFQPAVAGALLDEDGSTGAYVRGLAASLQARRDLLCEGLVAAGFEVAVPHGTYFVVADGVGLGFDDGAELCRRLPELAGVVGVPVSAFCREGSAVAAARRSEVRFTFVKREDVLVEAVRRLGALQG
ncbi:MAG: aminotransferase class [Actinotalea sp.]|nr:aminotransferase class [Actinotalea sp.]